MELSSSNYKRQDIVFGLCLIGILVLDVWKAQQGMGSSDEHFYTTLGYRLYQGDALFFDDWHIAQMIGVFLVLPVKAFIGITGRTDGIILFMRYCFVAFHIFVAGMMYWRFRSYGYRSILAAVVYLLFVPFNIMALSYNTMSVGFIILSLMTLPHYTQSKPFGFVLSGILFSCAVLNTPYLAVIYAAMLIAVLHRFKTMRSALLFFSIGVVISAVCFGLFVFSRASLSQVMSGLPHLIDPSHSASAAVLIAKNAGRLFRFFGVFSAAFVLEFAIAFFFKKCDVEKQNRYLAFCGALNLAASLYLFFWSRYQVDVGGLGVIILPFAVYGLNFRIIRKKDWRVRCCFDLAWVHSFLLMISSNVGPRSFTGPLILACSMTILMMTSEEKKERICHYSIALVTALMLLHIRISTVYDGVGTYDTILPRGPLKGLRDSQENADVYLRLLKDIETIDQMPVNYVNYVTSNSWEYLASRKRFATNSTYLYFWELQEYTDCQQEYRKLHEKRYPCYVYLDSIGRPYDLSASSEWFAEMDDLGEMNAGHLFLMR